MAKYVYPAIFTKEEHMYSIIFPDLENCVTMGDTLEDGLEMAEDALALCLWRCETEDRIIPEPSDISQIKLEKEQFSTLIRCDTIEYRKRFSKKAVKKTLTIPEWLNEEATALGVNFSHVLQEALIQLVNGQIGKK